MITFFTVLTEKSGMGNFFRMVELYNKLKLSAPCNFLLIADEDYLDYISNSIEVWDSKSNFNKIVDGSGLLVCDIPYVDNHIENFFEQNSFQTVIAINDATLDFVKPNYFFNTDILIKPSKFITSYLGLEYQIIRNDLIVKNTYPSQLCKVGVMFGGSDPDNLTQIFIQQIAETNILKYIHFRIIAPAKKQEELKQYTLTNNIEILVGPNMSDFYLSIDGLINMGGMSTYEAMYVGVPVFSVEWNYMAKYVRYLEEKKLIFNLGEINEAIKNFVLLKDRVIDITKRAKLANSLVDGRGCERIADKILTIRDDLNEDRNYYPSEDGFN